MYLYEGGENFIHNVRGEADAVRIRKVHSVSTSDVSHDAN